MASPPQKCVCGSNKDAEKCCGPAMQQDFPKAKEKARKTGDASLPSLSKPIEAKGYMMLLVGDATEHAQELHPSDPPSNVKIVTAITGVTASDKTGMSAVKITRNGEPRFFYAQWGHETGEASLEALLLELMGLVCEKKRVRRLTKKEFEGEMGVKKEMALRLQRKGVIG